MNQRLYEPSIVLLLAVIYWQIFCVVFDVQEPWDVPIYWVAAYPASIALSALAAWQSRTLGWTAGLFITFAQLPILLAANDLQLTILFAVGILIALPSAGRSKRTGGALHQKAVTPEASGLSPG